MYAFSSSVLPRRQTTPLERPPTVEWTYVCTHWADVINKAQRPVSILLLCVAIHKLYWILSPDFVLPSLYISPFLISENFYFTCMDYFVAQLPRYSSTTYVHVYTLYLTWNLETCIITYVQYMYVHTYVHIQYYMYMYVHVCTCTYNICAYVGSNTVLYGWLHYNKLLYSRVSHFDSSLKSTVKSSQPPSSC